MEHKGRPSGRSGLNYAYPATVTFSATRAWVIGLAEGNHWSKFEIIFTILKRLYGCQCYECWCFCHLNILDQFLPRRGDDSWRCLERCVERITSLTHPLSFKAVMLFSEVKMSLRDTQNPLLYFIVWSEVYLSFCPMQVGGVPAEL